MILRKSRHQNFDSFVSRKTIMIRSTIFAYKTRTMLQKLKSRRLILILFVLVPLFLGLGIYLIGRDNSIRIVNWFDLKWSINIPDWINYNLPDALFSFALMSTIPIIWGDNNPYRRVWEIVFIIFLLSVEFAQLVVPGTFDYLDFLFILGAILIYYSIK